MRKFILFTLLTLISFATYGQGKSISRVKKSKAPIETMEGYIIAVDSEVLVLEGSNDDGSYKYIQLLNSFNEPMGAATSRMAFKKQKVKFFKEEDGTQYLFTKFFVINVEAALSRKEIKLIEPK